MQNVQDRFFAAVAEQYPIVDFHVHPFSNPSENLCQYKAFLPMPPEIFRQDMRRAGIVRYAGSVLDVAVSAEEYATDFSHTRACNDAVMTIAEADPALIPGIHIHPSFPDESAAEIRRWHARGVRLIGELVPHTMGWNADREDELFSLLRLAGQLGMTVSFHSGNPNDMDRMIRALPETRFVLAHPGNYDAFCAHLERMKRYENVYLDLSGTGLFRYGLLEHGVRCVGSERFLFGSDYPVCSPGMNVGGVLYERLTETDRENIFFRNASRLLGISGTI